MKKKADLLSNSWGAFLTIEWFNKVNNILAIKKDFMYFKKSLRKIILWTTSAGMYIERLQDNNEHYFKYFKISKRICSVIKTLTQVTQNTS